MRTAWAWLHKLRRAMVRPDRDLLTGHVEVDETFVGGVSHGTDGAGSDKSPVMVAVERLGPHKLGRSDSAWPLRRVAASSCSSPPAPSRKAPSSIPTALGCSANSATWDTPTNTATVTPRRPNRGTARRTPRRVPAETLDSRHVAPQHQRQTPALLPRRVQLPLQPPNISRSRNALLPATANKPRTLTRTHSRS